MISLVSGGGGRRSDRFMIRIDQDPFLACGGMRKWGLFEVGTELLGRERRGRRRRRLSQVYGFIKTSSSLLATGTLRGATVKLG